MNVAVIKYNAGNIYSVVNALKRLGINPNVTDDIFNIHNADAVIFPGQGEAALTMKYLKERGLDRVIRHLNQPCLGICIGMQLMCSHSEEGDTECLGIFDAPVKHFIPPCHEFKIPHMGWDELTDLKGALWNGIDEGSYVYFIHSYYVPLNYSTIAKNDYILPYSAAMGKSNFYATQFHPEKSGDIGERILKNFLQLAEKK